MIAVLDGAIAKLYVALGLKSTISGDVAQVGRDFDKLEGQAEKTARKIDDEFKKIGDSAKQIGRNLSLAFTLPLVGAAAIFTKLAGDAAETQSKFEQVFGNLSDAAGAWAETTGDKVGRATTDLKDMLATTQSIVKAMGMGASEGMAFSQTIAQLSIDMGSFHNSSDLEAFTALRSAITGEYEPMKRFGVVLNEAKVHQELLNMGVKGGTKAANDAQKAQARMNIILRATADAQGDAERTAGSFANQMKALQADVKELGEKFGQDLLPTAQYGIGIVRQLIDGFGRLDDTTRRGVIAIAAFAASIGPVIWLSGSLVSSVGSIKLAIDAYRASTFAATLTTRGFGAALLATPAGLVALAVAGLVAGLTILIWHLGKTEDAAVDLGDALTRSAKDLRKIADEIENAEHPVVQFFDSISAGGKESSPILETVLRHWWDLGQAARTAEADQYQYAATLRDAMDAVSDAIADVDGEFAKHQRAVSDLTAEYDDLKDAIDRAMEMPEDIDDQGRAIEHAEIALARAKERLRDIQKDPESTSLDIREARLNVDDAEDRLDDARNRLQDLKDEQSEILGGMSLPQAQSRLAELEENIDEETAAMDEAFAKREELQGAHNAIMEANDEASLTTMKDNWLKMKKFFEENPIRAKKYNVDVGMLGALLGGEVSAFASGGIVTRPTLALVGEAGPEAIVPLRGGGNSSTSIGGDTLSIGQIIVRNDQDLDEIFRRWEEMQRSKRVQRGVRA